MKEIKRKRSNDYLELCTHNCKSQLCFAVGQSQVLKYWNQTQSLPQAMHTRRLVYWKMTVSSKMGIKKLCNYVVKD